MRAHSVQCRQEGLVELQRFILRHVPPASPLTLCELELPRHRRAMLVLSSGDLLEDMHSLCAALAARSMTEYGARDWCQGFRRVARRLRVDRWWSPKPLWWL
jgi:hypothetical protein